MHMLIRPSTASAVVISLNISADLATRAGILPDNAGGIVRIKANARWSGLEALSNASTQKWLGGWNPSADFCDMTEDRICQNDDPHLTQRGWL